MLKTVVWTMIKNGSYMCKPLSSKFKPHPCFLTIHSTLNCDVVSKTRADFLNYFETKTIHFAINVIKSEVWLIVWKLCIMFNFNNENSQKNQIIKEKKNWYFTHLRFDQNLSGLSMIWNLIIQVSYWIIIIIFYYLIWSCIFMFFVFLG